MSSPRLNSQADFLPVTAYTGNSTEPGTSLPTIPYCQTSASLPYLLLPVTMQSLSAEPGLAWFCPRSKDNHGVNACQGQDTDSSVPPPLSFSFPALLC